MCQELISLLPDLQALQSLLVVFNAHQCDPSILLRALRWQRKASPTPFQGNSIHDEDTTSMPLCPRLVDIEFQYLGPRSEDIDTDTISELLELFVRSRAKVTANDAREGLPSFLQLVRMPEKIVRRLVWLESMEKEGLITTTVPVTR